MDDQKKAEQTPAPQAEQTPAPQAEQTPAPQAEQTPKPQAEQTPKPQAEHRPGQPQRRPGGGRPGTDRRDRGPRKERDPKISPPSPKDIKPLPTRMQRTGPDRVEKEWVTITGKKTASKHTVLTEAGKELPCLGMPGYPRPEKGQRCRANIAYRNDEATEAVFKSWV